MRHIFIKSLLLLGILGICHSASAQGVFGYSYNSGFGFSSPGYGYGGYVWAPRHPVAPARYDSRIDPSLVRAAKIADQRAANHSMLRCWHYVKDALVAAGAVHSRPATAYACDAGAELMSRHGFVQLRTRNPYSAPVGAVIVYSGHGAGHVELRTSRGFASDYRSTSACRYHVLGIYAKITS